MAYQRPEVPTRPPVFLGCAMLLGILVVFIAGGACAIAFLESGANTGRLQLEQAEAYAPNSAEFVNSRNIFIVRTRDGSYFALSDLDAANRASHGRQCRVALVPRTDPELAGMLGKYASQSSPQAAGSEILFRETCNGALYDATGLRLNAEDAPNLDRYPVSVAANGRLEVNTARRECTQRAGDKPFAEIECG